MKTIYELELHEVLHLNQGLSVLRVAGGWIYRDERADSLPVNTFVPFDNGFMQSCSAPTNPDKQTEV